MNFFKRLHSLSNPAATVAHVKNLIFAAMDLQPPSVLAQLPRPLHASKGKTHIGEVYSLSDSKKRKRYEVAVAVDGEAVNIYNVGLGRLVASRVIYAKRFDIRFKLRSW